MVKKLSPKDWEKIKKLLESENRNIKQISKDFGISRNSIYVYARHRRWGGLKKNKKIQRIKYFNKIFNKIFTKLGIISKKTSEYFYFHKLRFEIFKRDNFTCQYCGRNVKEDKIKIHCDHIIPEKKNGQNKVENLITSCQECNFGKGDVLLKDKKINQSITQNGINKRI